MPYLNPGASGAKPKNWREAYDAFVRFRNEIVAWSRKLGKPMPPEQFAIIIPSKLRGMTDPRWQLQYIDHSNNLTTVYIGSDGLTARDSIEEIHRQYSMALYKRSRDLATNPMGQKTVMQQGKNDPRFNHSTVERMKAKWSEMIGQAKSMQQWRDLQRANPEVVKFMKMRAGILPMTMEEYLFRYAGSIRNVVPPRSQQELDGRRRQAEDYERHLARQRQDNIDITVDDGPGWQ